MEGKGSGTCTIKHYESVIYRKMTSFVVILAWTNTNGLDKNTSLDKQEHYLTMKSVHYGSVMFYGTGLRS
jgi:hypothetical protein